MVDTPLTRRQWQIYRFLQEEAADFPYPPTLDELCTALGLSSKGSLHKQIQALIAAGLVEPMNGRRRGIRLTAEEVARNRLPFRGYIAAGEPIEAVAQRESVPVPDGLFRQGADCYVLQVRGDSMIEEGILDGDLIVIEPRDCACNGEIVVALVDGTDATLKRIEQRPGEVVLHPSNARLEAMRYAPDRVRIQGVLVGQMRSYR